MKRVGIVAALILLAASVAAGEGEITKGASEASQAALLETANTAMRDGEGRWLRRLKGAGAQADGL